MRRDFRAAPLLILLACMLLLFRAGAGCCAERGGSPFQADFTHYADNEEICSVMTHFARAQGRSATCTPALAGRVSGRFEAMRPDAFLEGMRAAFGVRWYELHGAITFWQEKENTHAFLVPAVVSAGTLHGMFRSAGMISRQLPVRVLHDRNLLSANGPPVYVDALRSAMKAFEEAQGGRTTMRVFPLRFAWAGDITLTRLDTRITVPGVASILRAMAGGGPGAGSSSDTRAEVIPPAQPGLRGQGLAAGGGEGASDGQAAQAAQAAAENGARIIADQRVNAVVITDAEHRMEYYARVIADLDKPVELVEIHAAIVDIDSEFTRELGVNLAGSTRIGPNVVLGGSMGGEALQSRTPQPTDPAGAGFSFSTLYSRGVDFFLGRISALEKDGAARMLGRPSVLTLDNVQASLENTSTYYIPVAGKEASDLFKVEAGTVLTVTPHIVDGLPGNVDGIRLAVTVQDNRDEGSNYFSVQPETLSPIKQTKISTQAIVREGQSLLIGGYYYEEQGISDDGVPGLRSIPLAGRLFGTEQRKHKRMERMVLITPRIVRLDQDQGIPEHVDDPRFSRSAVQTDYEERVPAAPPVSGCARRHSAPRTAEDRAAPRRAAQDAQAVPAGGSRP